MTEMWEYVLFFTQTICMLSYNWFSEQKYPWHRQNISSTDVEMVVYRAVVGDKTAREQI